MKTQTKLWMGLVLLALLAPLGLILPEYFKSGPAWGEWGLKGFSGFWGAPLPDYALRGSEGKGLPSLSFDYIMSAVAGIALASIAAYLIGKMLARKGD
jgi:hypothetical protein